MTGFRRLPASASERFGQEIDRSEPVGWRWGGTAMEGLYGDTVASALLASGRATLAWSRLLGRPRGVMTLGSDDPHLWATPEGETEPMPASELALSEGFAARPAGDAAVAARFRLGAAAVASEGPDSRLLPFGRRMVERLGRNLALPAGAAPPTSARTLATREDCDVLVVGAGVAGLAAAAAVQSAGLRVLVVEATSRTGGLADLYDGTIAGRPLKGWTDDRVGALRDRDPQAVALRSVAIGIDADGAVSVLERKTGQRPGPARLRLIRPRALVLATGWRERPLTFAGNDRPGVILAGAARALLRRYAVAPGERVVVATSCDEGYRTAIDLKEAGVTVEMVVDARDDPQGAASDLAKAVGVPVSLSSVVVGLDTSERGERIVGVRVENRHGEGASTGGRLLFADALVVSGGLTARDELYALSGLPTDGAAFVAEGGPNAAEALSGGVAAGLAAARALGAAVEMPVPAVACPADGLDDRDARRAYVARLSPEAARTAFVDIGADVACADLVEASAQGVSGASGLARWLGLGRGGDGGRLSAGLVVDALESGGHGADSPPAPPIRPTLAVMAARADLAED